MLEYDEWVVPGELEYAEKKGKEIEAQIQKYHKISLRGNWERDDWDIYIQITEHIVGKFGVTIPKSVWYYAIHDIGICNSMILDWFRDEFAPIDEPKIFDLPDDDIRSTLPEWDESMLSDDTILDILQSHSSRYLAIKGIEENPDYHSTFVKMDCHLSDVKYDNVMNMLIKKLHDNKPIVLTEIEEKMACTFKDNNRNFSRPYYEAWDFPLVMSEKDIINAIREAYEHANIRSRRISPKKISQIDFENLDRVLEVDYHPLGNYECLYQGRAGGLVIRFLFDYKNMKIVMAYPVLKEAVLKDRYQEYHYYSKKGRYFTWDYFQGEDPLGWNGRK
ncbi:MAG: hypothetical protein K2O06_15565 [Acetatifactor sp.]|nr:hypothetical protein [Acetatifactor sp.]